MKKLSLQLFLGSSLSYLIMTIVRGKGSLPYWVQIPTTLFYGLMVLAVRMHGEDPKWRPRLSKAIPLFILGMFFPNMALTNMNAYESEVIWAFCLGTIFTLFQMFSLLYGLPFRQQLVLTLLGLVCVISNIEKQSTWKEGLRLETYPYIIGCVVASNYIQS